MSYCLNFHCPQPQTGGEGRFCIHCGQGLLLQDRYRPLQPLRQLPTARTFLGQDDTTGRSCVIKQVTWQSMGLPDFAQAQQLWLGQVSQWQRLGQHPQLPELLAHGLPDRPTQFWLVYPLIQGETLGDRLQHQGEAFTGEQVRDWLRQALPPLGFIHGQGVLHRDINPQNWIWQGDRWWLVDLSAAKILRKTQMATQGTVIGSMAYTAPEQLGGHALVESDLFSLGAIAVELLTLMNPWDLSSSPSGLGVWRDYLTQTIAPPLDRIIDRLIQEKARDRYASVVQLWGDLFPGEAFPQWSPPPLPRPAGAGDQGWTLGQILTGHHSSVTCAAFHPQGHTLASGSADRDLRLWDLASGDTVITLKGHQNLITGLAFDAVGATLWSGAWDYTWRAWQVNSGEEIQRQEAHRGWVRSLVGDPQEGFWTAGEDGQVIHWGGDGEVRARFPLGRVTMLQIAGEGAILCGQTGEQTLQFWHREDGTPRGSLVSPEPVTAFTLGPTGQMLWVGTVAGSLFLWHWPTGQLHLSLSPCPGQAITALALTPAGDRLLCGSASGHVSVWQSPQGLCLGGWARHTGAIRAIGFRTDGQQFFTASDDKTLHVYDRSSP